MKVSAVHKDNVEVVKETYNAIANFFEPMLEVKNSSQTEVDFMDKFMSYLPDEGYIVDLGCGVGKHGRYCAKRGYIVTGYDISDKMIELAKKYNNSYPPMTFLKIADIRKLECKESYSGVVALYSLIHLTKEQAFETLKNIKKYMNVGAYIIISVTLGTRNGYYEEPLNPSYQQYFCDYSEKEIIELLEKTGYTIIEKQLWRDEDEITASNPQCEYGVIGVIARK